MDGLVAVGLSRLPLAPFHEQKGGAGAAELHLGLHQGSHLPRRHRGGQAGGGLGVLAGDGIHQLQHGFLLGVACPLHARRDLAEGYGHRRQGLGVTREEGGAALAEESRGGRSGLLGMGQEIGVADGAEEIAALEKEIADRR